MTMKSGINVLVVLGARIINEHGVWKPSQHLRCRLDAAGRLFERDPSLLIILTGGYNVGVRYTEEMLMHDVKGEPENFATARFQGPSEAGVMQRCLKEQWAVPIDRMILEESSAFTHENARFVKRILFAT